jgi:hypothetical protein
MIIDFLAGAGIFVLIFWVGVFGFKGYLAELKAKAERETGKSNSPERSSRNESDRRFAAHEDC